MRVKLMTLMGGWDLTGWDKRGRSGTLKPVQGARRLQGAQRINPLPGRGRKRLCAARMPGKASAENGYYGPF